MAGHQNNTKFNCVLLNPAKGLGKRCKHPQRGQEWSSPTEIEFSEV